MKTMKPILWMLITLLLIGSGMMAGAAETLFLTMTTEQASVASDGTQGFDGSYSADISSDGRTVAFQSWAPNLVAEDNNSRPDIFVHDRQSRETRLVSVASDGTQGDNTSETPSISGNGQVVAFQSYAKNLVSDDTNGVFDIFVHDLATQETTRVSVSSSGTQAEMASAHPLLSEDGRYVTFESFAENLVEGDSNKMLDVFLHDRQTGETSRISVSAGGEEGNSGSASPSRLVQGHLVAFVSYASNLVESDTNGVGDIFLRDMLSGEIRRVSVGAGGTQANNGSLAPSLSANGRWVTFESDAYNLVEGDTNGSTDIFVRDLETNSTLRVSVASDGTQGNDKSYRPVISPDGRYVAFYSYADNLVSGDTYGFSDVFVHDLKFGETRRVSVASAGTEGDEGSYLPSIASCGSFIAFESNATNLVGGDINNTMDVFVRSGTPCMTYSQWLPFVSR